jgi:hypothetical protein
MTLEVQLNRLISELQQLRVSVEALAIRMDRLEKEPRSDFKFGPGYAPSYPAAPYITCRSKD